jgi:uncharacterized protein (DUF362 family)
VEDAHRVVIQQDAEAAPFSLLETALARARFWERVEEVRLDTGVERSEFAILIKPDLEIFDPGAPTGTDPRLVEHLILLLHRRGYPQVAVADGPGIADLWLENREVPVLADLVGYRYATDDGGDYDVVELGDDPVDAGFEGDSALGGSRLGRTWLDAHFRISMAKNKTDEAEFFSLGVRNLLGVLPLREKLSILDHRLDPAGACTALLDRTPVHFAIIDGVVSNHGGDGISRANPLRTDTVIAGDHLLLTDFVAAFKMGLDPYGAPLSGQVLRRAGLPRRYEIDGDLRPYPGWENVPKALAESVRRRDRAAGVARMIRPWRQQVNAEIFGFKRSLDERFNELAREWLGRLDRQPAALGAKVALNHALANIDSLIHGYRVLYDKDRLFRRQTDLAMRPSDYTDHDYESMVDYLRPLSQVVAKTPPDRNGLRWRYVDHSVLFQFSRLLPIDYDDFVRRVEIAAAVRLMNDNIGGACVVTARDRQGRITRQAERNLYLPQPNWMVLFGGETIDVGKLELIRYERDRQQIFWRTVTSANRSALYDDGIVTFGRDDRGYTRVTIVARQEFALPLFWQVVDIDYLPQLKDAIVSDAYTRFFSRTLANYEAAYEGRPVGIGREPAEETDVPERGEDGGWAGGQAADLLFKAAGLAGPMLSGWVRNMGAADPGEMSRTSEAGETGGMEGDPRAGGDPAMAALLGLARSLSMLTGPFIKDLTAAMKKDAALAASQMRTGRP